MATASRYYQEIKMAWDGSRYVVVGLRPVNYSGKWAYLKGDPTAQASEQASLANQNQQIQFSQQLMQLFQQQFGKQSAVLSYLQGKMQPIIDAGGTGYSADALAAMRTSATDTLSSEYQNAQKALNAKEFANGGQSLPSGTNAQLDAALLASEAADKSSAQNNITLANENVKQTNYWNAVNALSGTAAQENPLGYSGAATTAGNAGSSASTAVANNSEAVTASSGPTIGSLVGGVVGGALSGAGNAGGFGKLFSCWVASEIFGGWFEPRTIMVRNYINNDFASNWYGYPLAWFYAATGEWIAEQPALVKMLTPLFQLALRKAQEKGMN